MDTVSPFPILYEPLDVTMLLAGNICAAAYKQRVAGRFAGGYMICII